MKHIHWKNLFCVSSLSIYLLTAPVAGQKPASQPASRPARVKITISRKTTYILGPLNADGTVNYVAAINKMSSKGVTPKNNAAIPLIKALGPDVIDKSVREQTFKMLKMRPLPKKGDYFQDFEDYEEARAEKAGTRADPEATERLLKKAMQSPWSAKDYPLIADWLKANEKPLALALAASKRPRYYMPYLSPSEPQRVPDALFPTLGLFRTMSKALVARAMLKANAGRIDDACSDLLVTHRLARLIGQGPTLVDRLLAVRIEVSACKGASALAGSDQLTSPQAKAHLTDLQALPLLPSIVEVIDNAERFSTLDCVALCAREGIRTGIAKALHQGPNMSTPNLQIDWNVPLRRANQRYDRLVAAGRMETFAKRKRAWEDINRDFANMTVEAMHSKLRRRLRSSRYVGDLLLSLFMPPFGRAAEMYDQATMRRRVTEVALALAACKAEKGKYPEKLAVLKPHYLKKIPNDLFIEKPLHYKRTGEGYLLYSVGPDMKDDGGKKRGDGKGCDDIVVRAK